MNNADKNFCTQCPNHCPVTDLKCGRGRSYFGQQGEMTEEKRDHEGHYGYEQECGHKHEKRHEQEYEYKHDHGQELKHKHDHERKHDHKHAQGYVCEHGQGHKHDHGHGYEQKMPWEQDDLYNTLRACGHYLYHRFGKDMGQGRILAILSERESITQKELQEMLRIQPGSATEILTKLEEKGLLLRKRDERDKRCCIIELTEEGRGAFDRRKRQEEERSKLFTALDEAEQKELKRLLGKLLEDWE